MRTTVDLPAELHALTTAIARDSGTSLSETISRVLSVALATPGPVRLRTSERTGLTVFSTGRAVTGEDVRSLDDDR